MIIGLNNRIVPLNSVVNEFDDEQVIESRDKKIFYVGMTRTTELLFITFDGRPLKFIGDIYSEEEKVRQWMIKKLIDMYKYNIELIEIEKPVIIGSRPGL